MSSLAVLVAVLQSVQPPAAFPVGERFEYKAKFGAISVGSGSIEVASIDTVRGQPAYHFRFGLDGSVPFFKIRSSLDSWTSQASFHSLRFRRESQENSRRYFRFWEILADSGYYRQVEPELLANAPTPTEPLDDASFLYFVRTTPFEIGKTYTFDRYFRSDRNPIVIKVLKREKMDLPDGSEVSCLVLNPVIGESGLFGPRAEARLWISEDAQHVPVQIRSRYSFGTITLKLSRIVRSGSS
jgi:hypothetical protein